MLCTYIVAKFMEEQMDIICTDDMVFKNNKITVNVEQ